MVGAMFLAHLVGDYILQWDSLASWKSRALTGVLAHGSVVFIVTWLFSLLYDADWWQGVLFIGVAHILIDASQLYVKPPIPPLMRFLLDQLAHFIVIVVALVGGGFLSLTTLLQDLLYTLQSERVVYYLIGYAFITMPAWIIAKFIAYGLVKGTAPNFPEGSNKYIGILERILITTFVALGQFVLVPLVAAPRLAMEWPKVSGNERASVYLVELLCGIAMAIGIGLLLSRI
ncbi:MAG: DUF3307 domain-containing protein [Anaerolinea sp.]|nr:DUF3307 domain-containing protein [Anaerolinea sp.]